MAAWATASLTASAVAASALSAQVVVTGVVHDSLRGGYLAGAIVQMEGLGLRTVTDAQGRFAFRDVPLQAARLEVQAPFLDSVGLGSLHVRLALRPGTMSVAVSTPSLQAYQLAVCGIALLSDQAVLIGTVEDRWADPRPYFQVAAVWEIPLRTRRGVDVATVVAVDTSDAAGFFALCGVPQNLEFRLGAGTDSLGTQRIALAASAAPIRRHDLRIGVRERLVTASGRVVGVGGSPVSGTVEIVEDSSSRMQVGDDGRFRLLVPERTTQLQFRALGFLARRLTLHPVREAVDLGDIQLEPERPVP